MENYNNDVSLFIIERLKYLRDENGMTQKQLVQELSKFGYQITVDMISSFERGTTELKASQLNMFCTFYNVSADFIIGRSQYKGSYKDNDIIEFIKLTGQNIKLSKSQAEGIKTLIDTIYALNESENKT